MDLDAATVPDRDDEPDADPGVARRTRRTEAVARAVRAALGPGRHRRAMDVGTGAGGISPLVVDLVDQLVLVDVDEAALAAASVVLAATGFGHRVTSALVDLSGPDPAAWTHLGPVDVVYSVMALHHVPRCDRLLHTVAGLLRPGGRVLVADLEPDGGAYHAHMADFIGHDGIARLDLEGWLLDAGLRPDGYAPVHVDRRVVDGVARDFTIFLASATLPERTG